MIKIPEVFLRQLGMSLTSTGLCDTYFRNYVQALSFRHPARGGTKENRRNDFDRALASIVSYYIDDLSEWPEGIRGAKPCLASGIPDIPDYLSELIGRVRSPLRRKLDL